MCVCVCVCVCVYYGAQKVITFYIQNKWKLK